MPTWQGATLKKTLRDDFADSIIKCFEPFKSAHWDRAFDQGSFDPELVNCFELRLAADEEPRAWTLLHYAASLDAPAWVAARLTELGATRCAKDWTGRTPLDVAKESGGADEALIAELTPRYSPQCGDHADEKQLDAIEANFHKLIREVTNNLVDEQQLALPTVRTLLEPHYLGGEFVSFPVPGMYGGFYGIHVEFHPDGLGVSHLLCDSWCRVVGGSGRTDKVTAEGSELLASGFV